MQPENVQLKDEYSAAGMSSGSASTVSSSGIDVDGPVETVQHSASMPTASVPSTSIEVDNTVGTIQHYTLPTSQSVGGEQSFSFFCLLLKVI